MATKFETYRAESRYKRQPLNSSRKLKTLDQLLNEARAVKEQRALEEQYRFDVNNQQKALDEQRFAEEQQQQEQNNKLKWHQKIIPTIQETFGRVGEGVGSSLESLSDAQLNLADTIQYNLLKAKSGFYDILGNKRKANMYDIQANAINDPVSLNKPSSIPDEKMFNVGVQLEESSKTYANKYDQASYLKSTGEQVATGVGNMLPSIALGMIGGGANPLGLTTLGMQAFGGSSEQALEEGANVNQATAYGLLSSAKEVITEKLVGGGLGKLTGYTGLLDNAIAKTVSSKLGKVAIDILGEGLEEALAEGLEPAIKTITYDKNALDDYSKKDYWEGVLQAAIVGSLTGAVFDGANLVIRKGTNADVKDIMAEYDNLEKTSQALIADNKMNDLESKKIMALKKDLQSQLEAKLNKMSFTQRLNFIGKNQDNQLVLEYANKNDGFGVNKGTYTSKPLSDQQLGKNVVSEPTTEAVEDATTQETTPTIAEEPIKVVEKEKTLETPKVDLESNPKIKEANALYDKIKQVNPNVPKLVYDDKVGNNINGYFNKKTNTLVINPNVEKPATAILKHEIAHSLEGTIYYKKLQDHAIKYLKSKGEYDALVKEITENYSEQIKTLTGQELQDYIDTEVISHFSERLFSDQDSVNQLVKDNRSLAKKIYDFIKGLIAKISGNTTEKAELQRIEGMYKKALEENKTNKPTEVKKETEVVKEEPISKALEKEMEAAFLQELEEEAKEEQSIKEDLEKEVVAKKVETKPIQPKNIDDINGIKQPVYKTKTKEEVAQDKWLKEQGKKALKNVKVDENPRFSLAGNNLVAIHNLNEDKLTKTLDLGGFPMPSIAITKDTIPHENFGDISVLFDKNTINPQNSKNKVWAGDKWTPTFPQVDYNIDETKLMKLYGEFNVWNRVNGGKYNTVSLHHENIKDSINNRGLDDTIKNYANKDIVIEYVKDKIGVDTDVEKWFRNKLESSIKEKGIVKSNVDFYTRTGNRKSFWQTHYPFTIENIVNVMKGSFKDDSFIATAGSVKANLLGNYDSIEQIKNDSNKMVDEEKYAEERKKLDDNLSKLSNEVFNIIKPIGNYYNEFMVFDNAVRIIERMAKNHSKTNISNILEAENKYKRKYNISLINDIFNFFSALKDSSVRYFEAKPQRAVGLEEIKLILLPENTNEDLVNKLKEKSIPYEFYDENRTRQAIIQEQDSIKFSLNSKGEKLSPKQQEFFKDSKVRDEQGRLLVVYHGTNEDFNVFEGKSWSGDRNYFASTEKLAKRFGKNIRKTYLNITNPLIINANKSSWGSIKPFVDFSNQNIFTNKEIANGNDLVNYIKKETGRSDELIKKVGIDIEDVIDFAHQEKYNGVIIKNIFEGLPANDLVDDYIAFNPNQIKLTTNTNPSNSDDIRYSKTKESKFQNTLLDSQYENLSQKTTDILETEKALYETSTNKDLVDKAQEQLKGKKTSTQVDLMIKKLSNPKEFISKDDIAIIEQLILQADSKGFSEEASDLGRLLSQRASEMGQSIQALSIIQRLSPNGRLLTYNKIVEKSNADIKANKPNYTNNKMFKSISKERIEKWFNADLRLIKLKAVQRLVSNHEGVLLTNEERIRLSNLTHTSNSYETNVKEIISKYEKDTKIVDSITKEFIEDVKTSEQKLKDNYETKPVLVPVFLADRLTNAKTDLELTQTMKEIDALIQSQELASFWDKVNNYRYLSMLGNAKTHIRNIVSNSVMKEVVDAKSLLSRLIQTTFIKKINRTRTFTRTSNEMLEYGQEMYDTAVDEIQSGSKFYEARSKKQIFRNKILESARKFNFLMLSKEDLWFIKPRFSKEFGEWATAKGYTTDFLKQNDEIRTEGVAYAMEQAQKATFNDTCKLVTRLNALKSTNRLVGVLVDAVLPFTKTPINIARRAIEYSPIGLVKSLSVDIVKLRKGELNVSSFIENISSGLVGSGITVLGLFLAKLGIMSAGDDENKKKGAYDQTIGEQSFSIKILDKTYSLDWLAPSSIPLFMGVSLYNALKNRDENDFYGAIGTMLSALDPMTEMTVLRSFNSAMSTYDDSKLYGFVSNAMQSYAAQFLPTLGSQIAKIVDDTRRTTASTNQGVYTRNMERFWNYLQSKVPYFATDLEPYIDVWGNEDKNPSWEMRLLENMAFPFYVEKIKSNNPVDLEIMRLYEVLGTTDVLPSSPKYYYTKGGEKVYLNDSEYTQFKKDVGQFSKQQINALIKSSLYNSLSDEEKADAISRVYDYARDYAKKQNTYLLSTVLGESNSNLISTFQLQLDTISSKTDEFGNVIVNSKKNQIMAYINALPLSKIQKHLLFAEAGYKNSTDIDLVKSFINGLSNLSKEQKEQLFQMFNYD